MQSLTGVHHKCDCFSHTVVCMRPDVDCSVVLMTPSSARLRITCMLRPSTLLNDIWRMSATTITSLPGYAIGTCERIGFTPVLPIAVYMTLRTAVPPQCSLQLSSQLLGNLARSCAADYGVLYTAILVIECASPACLLATSVCIRIQRTCYLLINWSITVLTLHGLRKIADRAMHTKSQIMQQNPNQQ